MYILTWNAVGDFKLLPRSSRELRSSGLLHSGDFLTAFRNDLSVPSLGFKNPKGIYYSEYNQQDATFLNLLISVRRSACSRRVFRPSSGAQNCTYSVRHL